jgi:hypothetical protein
VQRANDLDQADKAARLERLLLFLRRISQCDGLASLRSRADFLANG